MLSGWGVGIAFPRLGCFDVDNLVACCLAAMA